MTFKITSRWQSRRQLLRLALNGWRSVVGAKLDSQGLRYLPLIEPRHAKTYLRAYTNSGGPDQLAHPRSLNRAFAVRKQNHWILQNFSPESKCPDKTAHIQDDVNPHICACSKALFRMTRSPFIYYTLYWYYVKVSSRWACRSDFVFAYKLGFLIDACGTEVLTIQKCCQHSDFIFDPVQERKTNWNYTGCQVPHFIIVLIPNIKLLNLSWIINCLFLRNMESLSKMFAKLLLRL